MNEQSIEPEHKKSLRRSWKSSGPVAKLTVIFAGMAALATLAYALFSGWQLKVMSGQLAALLESNKINRESLYSVQRAFVAMQKQTAELATYTDIKKTGKPVTVVETTAHWENIGNTPAIGVVMVFGSVNQQQELTEEQFMVSNLGNVTHATIAPKETMDAATIRQDESWFTERPGVPWFYWGWVAYRDIFPNTKTHISEFCWKVTEIKYKVAADGKRVGKPYFTAAPCAQHNCVDEFCEDYASIVKWAENK